jgi:hypothetical protein
MKPPRPNCPRCGKVEMPMSGRRCKVISDVCEDCGQSISQKRLAAVPGERYCVTCQVQYVES